MQALRVIVAEDSYLLRAGIVSLIREEDDISVVAECSSLRELLAAVAVDPPDVVLTDIRMPPTHTDEGIQAAAALRTSHPQIGVVVLSQYVEAEYALALFEHGSPGRAYLLKERIGEIGQLAAAIRAVADGGSMIDSRVVDALMSANTLTPSGPLSVLTPREIEVLERVASGQTNAAIARTLYVTERAVEKHINSIFAKLRLPAGPDVHRRVAAVLLFLAGMPASTTAGAAGPRAAVGGASTIGKSTRR